MNPALLALSRAYMALPGAPVLLPSDDGWSLRTPAGLAFRRASDGLLWLSDPDQPGTTPLAEERFVLAHPAAKWSDHQREAANKALADAVEVFGFPSPEAARLYRCEPLATGYPVPAGNR